MKFQRYTDGKFRASLRIEYRTTRSELARTLAVAVSKTEVIEDIDRQNWSASKIEQKVKDYLRWYGDDAGMDDIDGDEDQWMDWAEDQIRRHWGED
jgi:hypothetical protein